MTRATAIATVSLLGLIAIVSSGCRRGPARCPAGTRSTIEIRDGNGALELALKGALVCDGQLRVVAELANGPDGALLVREPGADPAVAPKLGLQLRCQPRHPAPSNSCQRPQEIGRVIRFRKHRLDAVGPCFVWIDGGPPTCRE